MPSPLPENYAWLATIGPLPKMVTEALKELGTKEVGGAGNNKTILAWAKETKQQAVYTADAIPWCGLFMDVISKRAGKSRPKNPLWALNWATMGKAVGQPILGDILTFTRESGGHVGIYIGEDKDTFHVLGGNQSDAVGFTRIYKRRLYAARRPSFLFRMPPSAKAYILNTTGGFVSTNEA